MVYTYTCPKCSSEYLIKKDMTNRNDLEYCPECKVKMKRKWTTSFQGTGQDQAFDTMVRKLKHSKPSGDRQIFF